MTAARWVDHLVGTSTLGALHRLTTVRADQLGEWTGYVAGLGGERLTIDHLSRTRSSDVLRVRLVGPADAGAPVTEVEMRAAAPVDIYGWGTAPSPAPEVLP